MLKQNLNGTDRIARIVIAVGLIAAAAFGAVEGTVAAIFVVVGVVVLATTITGFCPIYKLMHFSTNGAHRHGAAVPKA